MFCFNKKKLITPACTAEVISLKAVLVSHGRTSFPSEIIHPSVREVKGTPFIFHRITEPPD